MAKKISVDGIDESFIIASVRKDRTATRNINPPPLDPLPATAAVPQTEETREEAVSVPAAEISQAEETREEAVSVPAAEISQAEETREEAVSIPAAEISQREENRRRRGKQDYEALFIRESNVTARLGKTVYIRREFHDRILKIIQVVGENELSLFSYLDNIIAHHFENFREDIIRIYNRKNSSNIF
jgi:hypothetical protein